MNPPSSHTNGSARLRLFRAGALAIALLLTACGGSESATPDAPTTDSTTPASTEDQSQQDDASIATDPQESPSETSESSPGVDNEPEPASTPAPPTERLLAGACTDLTEAIAGGDTLFSTDELSDIDVELSQQVEDLLAPLADIIPDSAPPDTARMLEAAALMLGALGDAALADDPLSEFRTNASPAQAELETIDWEPVETYFEDECGIEVLGIELKLRSDDRVTTDPAAAEATSVADD